MIIDNIIQTEHTNNSSFRIPFPHTRTTKIVTIYMAIITGVSLHLIAHGNTTTLNMVGPIRMYKTSDKITGLMTGEIKTRNNGITTMKMINMSVMKVMNRPRIKEKAAAVIIINDLAVTRVMATRKESMLQVKTTASFQ
jgi:hypothetical protein